MADDGVESGVDGWGKPRSVGPRRGDPAPVLRTLSLGVDRDSDRLAALFDESDPAVIRMIRTVIDKARKAGRKIGLCGQAPSNDPAFAQVLVDAGTDSISVTLDSFAAVKAQVATAEARQTRAD